MNLAISRLGTAGDGIAITPDGATLHIPRTLPGEQVLATKLTATRAVCDEIIVASPDRVSPPCPHFALCGGCAMQHLRGAAYADWKRNLVAQALIRAGYDNTVLGPLSRAAPETRRRMDFAARRVPGGVVLGLHESHSETLIDIHVCPVLYPALQRLLDPLRLLLRTLDGMRKACDVAINLLPTGPDILLRLDAAPNAADRAKLAAFAERYGVGRIACAIGNGTAEIAALLRAPAISFGGVSVTPPPGAFLQASEAGQAAIVAAVLAGLPRKLTGRSRIIEMFAGIGTLSFPLAQHARVRAFEGDAAAVAALRHAAGGTRVEAVHRDLARQPLQQADLAGAAAVVLDPPYAGAASQMAPLAVAKVPTVIYVSCNPGALSRDAALLRTRNYKLVAATPIDQFLWSYHVECVCVFTKT